ncbi:MAG: Ig domain-containing protein [Hominisplanchenecus sp.]
MQLIANISPENATNKGVTWKSSNKKYATVSSKGVVKTKKAGKNQTVTITAIAKDGSGKKATYKIKIMPNAVKKVSLKASKTVTAGKKLKIKATVTPNISSKKINKKLKWSTSNKKYATVSSKGVVKTYMAGKGRTVTITAMSTDGTKKKAKIKIKIK